MGQRIIISEEEKGRIQDLYKQIFPDTPNTAIGQIKNMDGQTVNLYLDVQNKKFYKTAEIFRIKKTSNSILIQFVGFDKVFSFSCNKDHIAEIGGQKIYYSTKFIAELKKQFCGVSTGGTNVPKANFTQSSSSPSDMA